MLALAHAVDRLIGAGQLQDHAEAAFVLGITRARMSQISKLTLLAPTIQEQILDGQVRLAERGLRGALRTMNWKEQRQALQG